MAAWFFTYVSVQAQYKFGQATQFTQESGLPIKGARTIVAGEDGFVWAGADDGLCRFDGQQFKVWRRDPANPRSLFDNIVFGILPEKDKVWVGTSQGISVLDIRADTFRHYQITPQGKAATLTRDFGFGVSVLFKDPAGDIWIGTRTNGLWKYVPERDDFYQYTYPPEAYPAISPILDSPDVILSIESDGDSLVWAGTPAGLQQINKRTGKVQWFTFPQQNKDYQVGVNAFRRLCYHTDGKLYVGSWTAGVSVFDPDNQTLRPLFLKTVYGSDILKTPIAKIISRNNDELWITTLTGFVIYNTRWQEIVFAKYNQLIKRELYGAESIDKDGRAWQRTLNGFQCFDPLMQQFTQYSYGDMHNGQWGFTFYILPEDSGNGLIVCPRYTDGIYRFDKLSQSWTKFPFKGRPATLEVRGFARRRDEVYIVSAEEGLFTWSPAKGGQLQPEKPVQGIRFKRWGAALTAHDGNTWLCAGAEGLVCFNPDKPKPRIFGPELLGGSGPEGLLTFGDLFEDSRGNIWFTRNGGFGVYAAAHDTIYNFIYKDLDKNSFSIVNDFAEDKKGRVWLNSTDGWLGWADPARPELGVTYKMNLADKGILEGMLSLASDANGDIWGHTEKELLKINVENLELTAFNFQYGVKDVDFYHFSILPSGELLFGGRNDIVLANPAELQRNRELPVSYITDIQVLNKPRHYQSLYGGEPVYLRHWENFFSVGFSAKAFTLGGETRFRYRLTGFDDWTEASNRRFANYTNVPGGEYVFQLQAANNEGVWNETILEVPVSIATAWWATWWFRSAALLAIGGIVYGAYRYRVSQIRRKARLKTEYEKKLAQVEMSALLAQMNPHFLFNSLNSIDSYIVKNESKKASEYLNNFARLIRLILQHSRSDSISLADELEALDLYLQMESLRFDRCFNYKIEVDESLRTSSIVIPPMLIQPYLENAIWHGLRHHPKGSCEGEILLKITREGDYLHCIVEDNGIGREKSATLKAGKSGNNHKKSMGMRITGDRIDLINKLRDMDARVEIIDLKDEYGQANGTRVELTIPV
ncbi:MAG TPA: histidine kinase [Saprospiraceae bacterium]|nr:histidine kinase [Saprospiraceae bacterium]